MHVPLKHHRKVVFILGSTLLLVVILFVLALFQVSVFKDITFSRATNYSANLTPHELEAPPSPFLEEEEVVIIESPEDKGEEVVLPVKKVLFEYIEVTDSCGPYFDGECVNARSGPGTEYSVVSRLRNNVVLKVSGKVERDGHTWYKIAFDEWLRYPERVKGDWYVAADYTKILLDEGDKTIWEDGTATTTKEIIIDRKNQKLSAYDSSGLFLEAPISTGIELTPTPRGTFTIFKKTPSRYMQGPIPEVSQKYYDLPGVPWNLYFTHGGAVIHGAYWHNEFGSPHSNGCVNLAPEVARTLYDWADLGTKVIVRD